MDKLNLYIVIPNWNGAEFLRPCLDSLLAQTIKCSIIVVENGSTDESDTILATYGNKITVLKQPKNLGFDGGVNVGIKYSIKNGANYVALFNNDAIAKPNWLETLVKTMQSNNSLGIVTSKIVHVNDNILDSTGDFYTIFGLPHPRGRGERDTGQYDKLTNIFGASGGASLYNVKMLNKIGLFDEDFFAYYEDVDISFRAQLAGYKVAFAPKAVVGHHINGTSSKISGFATYHSAKNFWFLYIKNMPGALFFKYLPLAIYWYTRMFLAKFVRGGVWPFIKGFFAGLKLLPKKLKQRRLIQKNKIVSTKYIDDFLIHHRPPKTPKN